MSRFSVSSGEEKPVAKGCDRVANGAKGDPLPEVMRQLRELAQTGDREGFVGYCREIVRRFGRDTEALMRLARFCQKQNWHGGFELFMLRLAERLPNNRASILITLSDYLFKHGLRRGMDHLRSACEQLADGEGRSAGEQQLLERALSMAAAQLAARDDWEDVVKTFPSSVQGDLYLDLAAGWGTERPDAAFRAYRRGLRMKPDAWPGEALSAVALAHARTLSAEDPDKAMAALSWAANSVDDPRLESEAAAIAVEAGDKEEALRLSRRVFQRRSDDLDNLGRLAGLQAEAGAWGEVAALAQAIIVAVSRLNPWQREEYVPVVELAMEAWLRTGQAGQAEAALKHIALDESWRASWRERLSSETS